jgi:hypothetical protein
LLEFQIKQKRGVKGSGLYLHCSYQNLPFFCHIITENDKKYNNTAKYSYITRRFRLLKYNYHATAKMIVYKEDVL